jgi:hypothetical protein
MAAEELSPRRLEVSTLLQANAQALQPATPLLDHETETDVMFQNAGKKEKSYDFVSSHAPASGSGPGTWGSDRNRTGKE